MEVKVHLPPQIYVNLLRSAEDPFFVEPWDPPLLADDPPPEGLFDGDLDDN